MIFFSTYIYVGFKLAENHLYCICFFFIFLSKIFIMKKIWILWNVFWHLRGWSCFFVVVCFSFQFVCIVNYIYWYLYVELFLHLWVETYLIMVNNVVDIFLHLVCNYYIVYFCINIHKGNGSIIPFLCWVFFLWFGYQGKYNFIKWV